MTEDAVGSQHRSRVSLYSRVNKLWEKKGFKRLRQAKLWEGLFIFGIFGLALGLIQFATPNLVGNDGYYHIKMAYLQRTEGLKPVFDWLPLTVLNPQEYVDHHYLFHILMIPFTFGDLRVGAKVASVFFSALAFTAVWWLLKTQKVPYAALWSIGLLLISEAFLYRMNMPRAQSLSLLLLVVVLHLLLTGRDRWLILLGFLYVWSYNAFPLIIFVVGAYVAARWLMDRKLHWQPLAFSSAGVVLGLLINPYFPENLAFIYRHIIPKLTDATSISVGNEWFPYRTATLLENSGVAILAFLLGVIALGMTNRRMSVAAASSLLLVMGFGFMLFQSRRWIEYAPPFALIFAALAWSPLIRDWQTNQRRLSRLLVPGLAFLVLMPLLWLNLSESRKQLQDSARPYQRYAEASAWLVENSPENSRVFQTDWDDFPRLFFYNHHNTYTVGLDPTYMQQYDAELYELWVEATQGDIDDLSRVIQSQFGGEYVFSDLSHDDFLRAAEDDPGLIKVYEDEYAVVFQVEP